MEGKYYVYVHKLNDEVIYVGKGSGSRMYFSHRSEQWKKVVGENKALIKIEVVKRFDDDEKAYKFEKELTAYYKSIGQCKANINIGKNHVEIVKQKISEKVKGKNNSMYGKKFSNEHKRKLSEAHKRENNHLYGKTGAKHNCSKPIVAIFPDGKRIEAPSKNELSEIMKNEYNVSSSMINNLIKSGEPLRARYKRHEKAKGVMVKYIVA